MRAIVIPFVIAFASTSLPSQAGELLAYAGASLTFSSSEDSGTRQDLYGYIEGEYAHVYFGVSADIYNRASNDEIDPYIGYRSETAGGLTYDVSYTRSIYPNDGGDCCGDLNLSLGMPLSDKLTAGFEADYYPEDNLADANISLEIAVTDAVTLTGQIGTVGQSSGSDTQEWELAASYQLGETTAVVLHYYDGSDYKPYIALDLTWDVTLLGE